VAKKPDKPDFGKGGHLTIRVSEQGAHIAVAAGERIRCTLTVTGPGQAVFAFSCQHRPLKSAADFPNQPKTFKWTHFDHPGDDDAAQDVYSLVVAFAGSATSYTFLMEKMDNGGHVVATLKDFDASSTVAVDVYRDGITLFTA
jgi:hypothetical protein